MHHDETAELFSLIHELNHQIAAERAGLPETADSVLELETVLDDLTEMLNAQLEAEREERRGEMSDL